MLLDVFKTDPFHLVRLTTAVNLLKHQPTRINQLGWFSVKSLTQPVALIEMQGDKLTLVQTQPRGAPGAPRGVEKPSIKPFMTVHMPLTASMLADEVSGLRAFGTESEEEVALRHFMKKLAVCRRDIDLTIEWQRMGAIRGQVIDADGTTVLLDMHTEFGVAKSELDMQLDVDGTKVHQKNMTLKRMVEDKLGGTMHSGIRILASHEYMDAYVGHPAVRDQWRLYQESARLRDDYRGGFEIAPGVYLEEYRGQVGATRFVPAGKALAVPEGVADLFETHYAPANYMDTVNTEGLPVYAKIKNMDYDKGVEAEVQSNPLHLCTRPDAVVELSI